MEIWKTISNSDENYCVSNYGWIKSLERTTMRKNKRPLHVKERIMRTTIDNRGYSRTMIGRKTVKIHRVVAEAFIKNPNYFKEVNHIDGNKQNNCVENLEWTNRTGNMRHAFANNLMPEKIKKVSDEDVLKILKEYIPYSITNGTAPLAKKYGISASYLWRIVVGQKRANGRILSEDKP